MGEFMRKTISFAVFCGLVAGLGCQGGASFKTKTPDGGVVELNAKGDTKEVTKLLDKTLGTGNYEVTEVTPPPPPQGQESDGKKYYAFRRKMSTTPAGLPPAPNGTIQQTGGTGLPIPQLPATSGTSRTGSFQPGMGQPGMPATGKTGFAGDR